MTQIERFLAELRGSHPDMVRLYTEGRCYHLWLIMRVTWPQARCFYSPVEGHVYVEIDGALYDIRGRHLRRPDPLDLLDHRSGHAPHRWGRGDKRRLTDH